MVIGAIQRNKTYLRLSLASFSFDYNEGKPQKDQKLRNQLIFYLYRGTFEQLVCPRGGAFARLSSKNPNARGLAWGGWALLERTDA